MSVKIMAQVWDLELQPHAKLVLLALADHADHEGGRVYPTVETIARKVSLSVRQTQRHMSNLRSLGYLVVEKEATRYDPTRYRIQPGVSSTSSLRGDTQGSSGVTPTSPRIIKEPSGSEANASANGNGKVSEHDVQVLWKAIEAEGIKAPIAKSPRSSFAKLVRELVAVHASEADVRRWTKLYRAHPTLGKTMLTLPALVKWAPQLESDASDPGERLRLRLADLEKRGVIPA